MKRLAVTLSLILLQFVSFRPVLALPALNQKLLKIYTEDKAQARNLNDGQWTTVFRRQVSGNTGDVLSIHGLNQVTTEDNDVIFSAVVTANGIPAGPVAPQTARQPDDVGGNHHMGLYAIAIVTLISTAPVTIEFRVQANIQSRKRGEIFVDPAPGNGISQGRLLIEHYSPVGSYSISDVQRFGIGSSGSTFCCLATNYKPVLEGIFSVDPGEIVKIAGQVTAIHNSATRDENGFDGEQIGTAFLFLGAGISGYIGENVTSRNAKLSVFNETLFESKSAGNTIGLSVGANFGRGAYLDNAATTFDAVKWSQSSTGLQFILNSVLQTNVTSQTLAENMPIELSRQTIDLPGGGLLRTSISLSLRSDDQRASVCRFDLNNGSESTTSYRSFGNGYRLNSVRLELDSKTPNPATTTVLTVLCSKKAFIIAGSVSTLVFAP